MGDALEVRGLSKHYGGRPVLDGLDLSVGWGETVALFGPNGSGKSTFIRLVATLAQPTGGEVRVGGLDPRRDGSMARRLMGVVTHQTCLYDDLTPLENLRYYARMFGVVDAEGRAQEVARGLGIDSYLNARVRTLSHGMQKRVSLARALLHRPRLLLLDEPETGLDQEALGLVEGLLGEHREGGGGAVVTTHNVQRGLAMADRVAILARGRIAYSKRCEALDQASFREAYLRYTGSRL